MVISLHLLIKVRNTINKRVIDKNHKEKKPIRVNLAVDPAVEKL